MSIATTAQAIPRSVVVTSLRAARLPLGLVGRVTKHPEASWPPALAFEGFEATVEQRLGTLLKDDTLTARAVLRRAKVTEVKRAAELAAKAEEKRQSADAELHQRQAQTEQRRTEAREQAQHREQAARAEADTKARAAKAEAARKETAAQTAKASQDKAIDRQERAAKAAALAKESAALDATKRSVEAERTVDLLDSSIDASKAARTNR